jgi:hypothetical protein
MRRAAPALAALAAALLAGCGNPGGDLMSIEVREPTAGTPVERLVVTDDGRGRCNAGDLERLPSERLLEAREVERELEDLVVRRVRPRALPGRRAYRAHMREGTIGWSEGDVSEPVLPKGTLLATKLRHELCPARAGP